MEFFVTCWIVTGYLSIVKIILQRYSACLGIGCDHHTYSRSTQWKSRIIIIIPRSYKVEVEVFACEIKSGLRTLVTL